MVTRDRRRRSARPTDRPLQSLDGSRCVQWRSRALVLRHAERHYRLALSDRHLLHETDRKKRMAVAERASQLRKFERTRLQWSSAMHRDQFGKSIWRLLG